MKKLAMILTAVVVLGLGSAKAQYNRHYFAGLSPTDGTFKILTQFTSDYIVDVSGYFAP